MTRLPQVPASMSSGLLGYMSRLLCLSLLMLGFLPGLTGCAGSAPNATTMAEDIVTDSDEPEARKRARIRLELALGYFDKGQTTVALDEVKQALAVDPAYAQAYNLRGLIYLKLDDFRLAEDSLRRAVALNARDADAIHNLGWLQCQQGRYAESQQSFNRALSTPAYGGRAKTWLTQGLCQIRAGQPREAEASLLKAYELDAANPVTGFNLANLLWQRGELARAQFYIRRLNNSESANSESLWLAIKIERSLGNFDEMRQLGTQLSRRFAQSREAIAYERGSFHE